MFKYFVVATSLIVMAGYFTPSSVLAARLAPAAALQTSPLQPMPEGVAPNFSHSVNRSDTTGFPPDDTTARQDEPESHQPSVTTGRAAVAPASVPAARLGGEGLLIPVFLALLGILGLWVYYYAIRERGSGL